MFKRVKEMGWQSLLLHLFGRRPCPLSPRGAKEDMNADAPFALVMLAPAHARSHGVVIGCFTRLPRSRHCEHRMRAYAAPLHTNSN